ncbi:serine/threonine-protein phosphatase [Mycoplasma sp. CSL10137]|uniref:PP2C family protein-serine/threonine phosphatase n=1 Tax=unclassified Mycoplasma TaxID=2683645 RepID=UPI00197B65CB|nr:MULTISPECIES: protein phosphatase 2C domain-containing protein [unclassified Mycoplasma]MBN4083791.1 serine/threonine-protein phosphatase [Mycoplasma sp. CSL10137]MBN4084228.1 serine/threonine-protein phosphatase [Mycoplasma sp. CSL10166]MBU4692689.1 protein phosphatase 2C domain-containing protein [Mycoplasma sp. CSL7491-lung]
MIKEYFSISEKGNVRENNEDKVEVFGNEYFTFAILCDGMGGHDFGEIASAVTITTIKTNFINYFKYINSVETKNFFIEAINKVKIEFKNIANLDISKSNMGTTFVGVLYVKKENKIFIFNIGDSRAYFLDIFGNLTQITEDQNYGNLLLKGTKKEIDLDVNYTWKYLTSSIGINMPTTIQFFEFNTDKVDILTKVLLTSDGLHDYVDKGDIESILKKDKQLSQIANTLLEKAKINESDDNMSLILLDFGVKNE